MKKVLVSLVVFLIAMSLFASGATEDGGYKGVTNNAFATSLPADSDSLSYKLHVNPATLSENKLIVQFPSLAIDGYNIADTISKESVAEAVSHMLKFKFSKEDLVRLAVGMLENVGSGYNSVMSTTVEAGAAINHFAFGIDAVVQARTMPAFKSGTEEEPINMDPEEEYIPQTLAKTGVVPVVDIAATVSYGMRVLEFGSCYLDAGASVRVVKRSYLTQLSADTIINEGLDFNSKEARSGFAVPLDLSAVLGVLNGDIRFSVSANNLNGYFYMQKYANYKDALSGKNGYGKYTVYSPWNLNAGVEISHKWSFIEPKLTIRFEDIVGFFKNEFDEENGVDPKVEIYKYLTFRADIRLVKFVKLNAAFRKGYLEFGGALDFYGNSIELSYGYHEAGDSYGEKPVDTLTLRIKLGFDKN